jgi:hypothetical protein
MNLSIVPQSTRKPRERISGLSYYPRLRVWKASNVVLSPENLEATSYDWWFFLKRIGPYTVFNTYGYSPSTRKHQSKVRSWLWNQSILFIEIECPRGLQSLDSAINHYQRKIQKLQEEIAKPRTRPMKNHARLLEIAELQTKLQLVQKLIRIQGAR